jgi:hypothetical protein
MNGTKNQQSYLRVNGIAFRYLILYLFLRGTNLQRSVLWWRTSSFVLVEVFFPRLRKIWLYARVLPTPDESAGKSTDRPNRRLLDGTSHLFWYSELLSGVFCGLPGFSEKDF